MSDFVQLTVSNSQNDTVCFEKKFPKDMSISELKVNSKLFINKLKKKNSKGYTICLC